MTRTERTYYLVYGAYGASRGRAPRDPALGAVGIRTLGGAAGLGCLGLVARDHGIPVAWALGAIVLGATAPGFFVLARFASRLPAPAPGASAAPG